MPSSLTQLYVAGPGHGSLVSSPLLLSEQRETPSEPQPQTTASWQPRGLKLRRALRSLWRLLISEKEQLAGRGLSPPEAGLGWKVALPSPEC